MEKQPHDTYPHLEQEQIVLVEDSPVQAIQIRLILERAGYAVHVCPNGAMALARIAESQPDLILLDLRLPDISGQDIARRLKQDPLLSGIPIIFLTGVFRQVQDVIRGLDQADDYIDKDVEEEELIARIRASLRARRTQRELGRLARLLLTVNQVASQLAGFLDSASLPDSVVRLVHERFDYPHAHLFLLDGNVLTLVAATGAGARESLNPAPHVRLDEGSFTAQSVNTGQLVLIGEKQAGVIAHPFLKGVRSFAAVPLRSAGQVSGVLEIASPVPGAFNANDGLVLQTLADMAGMALHNSRMYQSMEELATLDGLTGLLNRRTILRTLDDEWNRARRYRRAFSLVILDIDNFKPINDTYGHATGDRAIQTVALLMKQIIRNVDLIGRWGGDEFLLVLPETDQRAALEIAERVRRDCQALVFKAEEGSRVPITLSLGIASWPLVPAANQSDLLKAADQALYCAKSAGRNRVSADCSESPEAQR